MMPAELQEELNQRLVKGSFSDYRGLTGWLSENGYVISKSSLQEYGAAFQQRLAGVDLATRQARAIVEASPDDEGAMTDALTRLVQRIFTVLMEIEDRDGAKLSDADLARFARAIGNLSRATVSLRRWTAEYRERLERQKRAASDKVTEILRQQPGLSADAEALIRKALLGIDPFQDSLPESAPHRPAI